MVAILEKSDAAQGFEQIIDFLSGSYIHHALTMNPHVYISCIKQIWNTAVAKRSGDVTRLQALVDKKRNVITKEVVRDILQLNDAEGVICLPNDEIFAGLARIGYEKPSTKLTFYKAFFSTQWKFFIHIILHSLSAKRTSWNEFSYVMASALICISSEHAIKEIATEVVQPTPTSPSPSSPIILSIPPHQSPFSPQPQAAEEIIKLKARVKKLERLNKVKLSKLRRLKKVGTSQRVESSEDEENVFNQGRISVDMNQDERVELVVDQEKDAEVEGRQADTQAEIYNIDLDHSSKVVAASAPIPAAKPKVLKIAAAPAVSTKKRKRVVIRDPEEELHDDTLAETPSVKDKGKGILIKDPKPMRKKDQIEMDAEEEMEKEDEEIIKSINETLAQKAAKRRNLSEEAQEADDLRRRLEIVPEEDDDVFVEDITLSQKASIVDYQVVVIDNRPKYKIIREDDTHQFYISFPTLLKNFDREDLETLWRIVKDHFSTKKPTNFSYKYLLLTHKIMFGELDE
nr:hypothetical protein [Tanacetum cinerariifolium]